MKMKKILCMILAVVCMTALLASCGSSAQSTPQTESETSAETAGTSEGEPGTVVALSKSIGDLWLLAGGKLAGITDDGLDLEGIGDAVSIGSLVKPSLESITALKPDLVMMTQDIPTHKSVKEALQAQKVNCMVVDINGFDDYDKTMKELTGMTGREDLYKKNVTDVKENIDKIISDNSSLPAKGKTYLALQVSATKNKIYKDDYFGCEIFNNLGMKNIAQDDSSLDDLSIEAIVSADPDYIFVIPKGDVKEAEEAYKKAFSSNSLWASLKASKEDHIYTMDKEFFSYKPNARWADAYQYVVDLVK